MATAYVTETDLERRPFPTTCSSWTVVDDDVVIVGGRVRDHADADRVLRHAAELPGPTAVLSDLEIDDSVPAGTGALVVIDSSAFEDDVDVLSVEAESTLATVLAVAERYEEILMWVAGGDDRAGTDHEAIELSRRRVLAIHQRIERSGRWAATVRVEQRDGDLTGRALGARRRYAVRISNA